MTTVQPDKRFKSAHFPVETIQSAKTYRTDRMAQGEEVKE